MTGVEYWSDPPHSTRGLVFVFQVKTKSHFFSTLNQVFVYCFCNLKVPFHVNHILERHQRQKGFVCHTQTLNPWSHQAPPRVFVCDVDLFCPSHAIIPHQKHFRSGAMGLPDFMTCSDFVHHFSLIFELLPFVGSVTEWNGFCCDCLSG